MEEEKKPQERANLTIDIDDDLYSRIFNLAEDKGLDMASQIKFILWEYFEN